MSTNILANVSNMFSGIEPCYVSGSQAELGDVAGQLTWRNALAIAANHASWLESDEAEACEGMRDWARATGAWDAEESEGWSVEECLALFVQNVASELRMLGSDNDELEACAARYSETDWEKECEYPTGSYFKKGDSVHVEYYTGC